MKKNIFIIIIFIFAFTLGVYAKNIIDSSNIIFRSNYEEWQPNNLSEAINDLYSINNNNIEIIVENTTIGNSFFDYTFEENLNFGLLILTASQNVTTSDVLISEITDLTDGTYEEISDTIVSFQATTSASHRSHIYKLKDIKKGSILSMHTRYGGMYQILRIK